MQPDGLEETRMYPVPFLRILTRTVRLRQGDKLLMSGKKLRKAELTMIVSKWVSSVIVMPGQWDPGGSGWSPYALGRGVTLKNVLEAGDWRRVSTFKRL